jgi:NADH dehydrogenase
MTFRQVVEFVCRTAERRRIFVNTPFPLAAGLAALTEFADRISFGFFPKALTMTRDDIALLRTDNVVSPEVIAAGLTLAGLGIEPEAVEAIAPAYLYRFRRSGQYADSRFA